MVIGIFKGIKPTKAVSSFYFIMFYVILGTIAISYVIYIVYLVMYNDG